MKRIAGVLMIAMAVTPATGFAEAAHICWITQVSRVDEGVKVDFSGNLRVLSIRRADTSEPDSGVSARRESRSAGSMQERSLVLAMGDTAAGTMSIPEDYCQYKAEVHDGQVGVTARSIMRLHGLPPTTTTEFIAAE
ncbi:MULTISPECIES: hypothetical protein [Burkholderia]|uniref:hypothetical protein n=1 Tax=Burkholderia TaxID=32008 RepID=UPI00106500AE|nr:MULTISPECIES: hypothetical protein [Burkholderia]MDP9542571.1 glutamine synthetase type III [Burkholderia cepacia]MBR7947557.1 hypothetical protein [Burkholderia cenocepacia]MBR8100440.1 hypothetical protein [Burkholderia cenocepacia]MBR8389363.1 hypothetical protein [Burkholderia cenocepacia]MBR8469006.1 hypothetical protein [Burkholderia cenocepacia]